MDVFITILGKLKHFKISFSRDSVEEGSDPPAPTDILSSWKAALVCVIILALYVVLGILFYSFTEGWDAGDAFYYTIVTCVTVGYGDFAPTKTGTKIFTIFFIFAGISMAGVALGILGSYIVKQQQEVIQKALSRKKKKKKLHAVEGEEPVKKKESFFTRVNKKIRKLPGVVYFRKVTSPAVRKLLTSFLIVFFMVCLGAVVTIFNEGFSTVDGFYWASVTCTTVGYGDIPLKLKSTRIFAAFYIMVGCLSVASSVGNFAGIFIERQQEKAKQQILNQKLTRKSIEMMDKDNDGLVSPIEFAEFMLIRTGKVTKEEFQEVLDTFARLDVDKSGNLDQDDLKKLEDEIEEEEKEEEESDE